MVFYYTKNRPSTVPERSHIAALVGTIKARTSRPGDRLRSLLIASLGICGPEVRSHPTGPRSGMSEIPVDDWHLHDDPDNSLLRCFKDCQGDWYDDCPDPTSFLRGFLSDINALTVEECEGGQLSMLIEQAHFTGSFEPVTAVFPDAAVAKRMRILGKYF